MKLITFLLALSIASFQTSAQKTDSLASREPAIPKENITVEQIATDSLCTAFQIWIEEGVKHHFHQTHTECIYILEGAGVMTLEDSTFQVNAGDFILVPRKKGHSVTVTSRMKVLSIQTPQWVVDDRQFIPAIRRPHNE